MMQCTPRVIYATSLVTDNTCTPPSPPPRQIRLQEESFGMDKAHSGQDGGKLARRGGASSSRAARRSANGRGVSLLRHDSGNGGHSPPSAEFNTPYDTKVAGKARKSARARAYAHPGADFVPRDSIGGISLALGSSGGLPGGSGIAGSLPVAGVTNSRRHRMFQVQKAMDRAATSALIASAISSSSSSSTAGLLRPVMIDRPRRRCLTRPCPRRNRYLPYPIPLEPWQRCPAMITQLRPHQQTGR